MNPILPNLPTQHKADFLPNQKNSPALTFFLKTLNYLNQQVSALHKNLQGRDITVKVGLGLIFTLLGIGLAAFAIKSVLWIITKSKKDKSQPAENKPVKEESHQKNKVKFSPEKIVNNLPDINSLKKPYVDSIPGTFIFDCDLSQGRLSEIQTTLNKAVKDDDALGSLACASICMQTILHFFSSGLPQNEKEMYTLIDRGAQFYKEKNFQGTVDFYDVLKEFPEVQDVSLQEEDMSASRLSESTFNILAAIQETTVLIPGRELVTEKETPERLPGVINFTKKKEELVGKKKALVLTTNIATQNAKNQETNATLAVLINENNEIYLFNSHGQTYFYEENGKKQDSTRGASLIKFEDVESLNTYVKKFLFKEKGGILQCRAVIATQ